MKLFKSILLNALHVIDHQLFMIFSSRPDNFRRDDLQKSFQFEDQVSNPAKKRGTYKSL